MDLGQTTKQFNCVPLDKDDLCVEYNIQRHEPTCIRCKQGYSMYPWSKYCVQSKLVGCYSALHGVVEDSEACVECLKGFPSKDQQSCVPFSIPQTGRAFNCKVGGTIGTLTEQCIVCEEGYSVLNGFCVSTPSAIEGCGELYDTSGDYCRYCQGANGWYDLIASSSKCVKQ